MIVDGYLKPRDLFDSTPLYPPPRLRPRRIFLESQ